MLKNQRYFSRFAWFYLIYNFYVVLGGAYVRATGSGAGCGAHWPLCNGKFVPNLSILHTIIEFTHRASSAIVTVGAVLFVIWAFSCTHKGDAIRKTALLAFLFMIIEGFLGAGLVKFELVENNSSLARVFTMALHLAATFMLFASITLTAAWSSKIPVMKINFNNKNTLALTFVIIGLFIVGSSGAITALGDTIFHPNYIGEGLISDLKYESNILKSIRIYHPVLAILISIYCLIIFWKNISYESSRVQINLCKLITIIIIVQILFGVVNIALLAPVWMQIIHLFIADLLWVMVILFFNNALAKK